MTVKWWFISLVVIVNPPATTRSNLIKPCSLSSSKFDICSWVLLHGRKSVVYGIATIGPFAIIRFYQPLLATIKSYYSLLIMVCQWQPSRISTPVDTELSRSRKTKPSSVDHCRWSCQLALHVVCICTKLKWLWKHVHLGQSRIMGSSTRNPQHIWPSQNPLYF